MTDSVARRRELYGLLGDLPERDRPIAVVGRREERREGYVLERLVLDLNGVELVPAYFARPAGEGPFPAVLYNHSHGGRYELGKDELLTGTHYLQPEPYAEALARQGVAALAIDHWAFGGRRGPGESALFKRMLWEGRVMWGMMVYDSLRALDYLAGRADVAAGRVGTLGMSMGSTMAWWVAALDERVKVTIDLCCLTDYQALIDAGGLDLHGVYYYVPRLPKHFTAGQINALIAPRARLALAGDLDPLTPPAGLDRIDAEVRAAYAAAGAAGAAGNWRLERYPVGHVETAEMRANALKFLAGHL
jgi:dienelactone hydrolase